MEAAYVEFRLESSTMNTREFYASRQGTHRYLTKEAVANAITYSEVLQRSKVDEWKSLASEFEFDCTPAMPVSVQTLDTIYKAGDDPNSGLLRYGRQELLLPGSIFRFAVWGTLPPLWKGQMILIGKKRAAAQITKCVRVDAKFDTINLGDRVMPIQVSPSKLKEIPAYVPLILTARYAIIQIHLQPGQSRFIVEGWAIPLGACVDG
jgi:hypothetical protein